MFCSFLQENMLWLLIRSASPRPQHVFMEKLEKYIDVPLSVAMEHGLNCKAYVQRLLANLVLCSRVEVLHLNARLPQSYSRAWNKTRRKVIVLPSSL